MIPTLNRKIVQKAILVIAIILLHVFFQKIKNSNDKIERKTLAKQISKQVYKQEIEVRKKIFKLEKRLSELQNKDTETQKEIEKANINYKKIIFTIKKLSNERIKQDIKIINASDSSDWNWFSNRFPKHNNKLSSKTNQIVRKSSNN